MVFLFTDQCTARLRYTARFIFEEILKEPYHITCDLSEYVSASGSKINYSDRKTGITEIQVEPSGLLTDRGIRKLVVSIARRDQDAILFPNESILGFDIFSAVFYLLSRYEEYLPHQKDAFGNFDYRNSLAFRHGFLQHPVVNTWLIQLRRLIEQKFPATKIREPDFKNLLTYDVDIAFAYRYKPLMIQAGSFIRRVVSGSMREAREQVSVLASRRPDPYYSFDELINLHQQNNLQTLFFILASKRYGGYNRNNLRNSKGMLNLIETLARTAEIGIHPSFGSVAIAGRIEEEKNWLEQVTNKSITKSRQHYLRFDLPDSYRRLIRAGIKEEYSMGYSIANGFRASVSSPFYWYDLSNETETSLKIFPFAFMDSNSFYKQHHTAEEAGAELQMLYSRARTCGSCFISIWHNNVISCQPEMREWLRLHRIFASQDA